LGVKGTAVSVNTEQSLTEVTVSITKLNKYIIIFYITRKYKNLVQKGTLHVEKSLASAGSRTLVVEPIDRRYAH
jgi:hypothetical protein